LFNKNEGRNRYSLEFIIGESIGEIEREDDTDERISLPNEDDGDIDDDDIELHGKLSGYSSCKK
jgi:hypothetical protein